MLGFLQFIEDLILVNCKREKFHIVRGMECGFTTSNQVQNMIFAIYGNKRFYIKNSSWTWRGILFHCVVLTFDHRIHLLTIFYEPHISNKTCFKIVMINPSLLKNCAYSKYYKQVMGINCSRESSNTFPQGPHLKRPFHLGWVSEH